MDGTDLRGPEEARYPWQQPLAPIWPAARLTPAQRRRTHAGYTYRFEHHLKDEPTYDSPLVYDARRGFFRFARGPRKGRFAVSREYADWEGLWQIGYFDERRS